MIRFVVGYLCVTIIVYCTGAAQAIYMAAAHGKILGPLDTIGGAIGLLMFVGVIPVGATAMLIWVIFGKTWRS